MRSLNLESVGKKSAVSQVVTISSGCVKTGATTVSPFNERGVVVNPGFQLVRPKGHSDQIEFSVRAHAIGDGFWIAELAWHCNNGHTPGHCQQPSRQSQIFKSRSEAVDDVIPLVRELVRPLASTLGTAHDSAFSAPMAGGAA